MTKHIIFAALSILLTAGTLCRAQQKIEVIFPCSEYLENPYGLGVDLTRKSGDYEEREKALDKVEVLRAGTIRMPMWWDNMYQGSHYLYFIPDDAISSVKQRGGIEILGTISPSHDPGLNAWNNPEMFREYLSKCLDRYGTKVKYWELMPGSDALRNGSEPVTYAQYFNALKTMRSLDNDAKIVLGSINNLYSTFVDSLSALKAYEYFDVVGFALAKEPESMLGSTRRLRNSMDKYKWEKPVWLTQASCSSFETPDTAEGFWLEIVPKALEVLGFQPKSLEIALVYDPAKTCCALNQYQIEKYLQGRYKKIRYLSLDELPKLDPVATPVLIPALGSYSTDVANYIRKGGTVIMENAVWPSVTHIQTVNSTFYEEAKAGAKPVNTYCKPAPGYDFKYSWQSTKQFPARYLTKDGLRESDEMIPLLLAGNDGYEGTVAAIYKLNSANNKGRIIIQARNGLKPYVDPLQDQAKRIARTYLIAFSRGVDRVYWNKLRTVETGDKPYQYNGIVRKDFSDKPSAKAYKVLTSQLPAGSRRPTLAIKNGVYLCSWSLPNGDNRWAVWSPSGVRASNLNISGKAVCTDFLGTKLKSLTEIQDGVTYISGASKVEFK